MDNKELVKMLEPVKDFCQQLLDSVAGLSSTTEMVIHDDDSCDPMLVIDGHIQVVACEEVYNKGINGVTKMPGYVIGYENLIPGCRTLPNGDPGYPDETDFVEESSQFDAFRAAADAVHLLLDHDFYRAVGEIEERRVFEEIEEIDDGS